MAGIGNLAIELGASTATLSSDLDRATGMVSKAVADINVTINKVGSGANFNGVSSEIEGLKASFASLQSVAAGVFGVGIGAAGVRQLMDVADQYQNVTNRILTTVSGTDQLVAVQDRLFAISQETGQSLDATAKIYQRLEQVIEGTGKTQIDAQQQSLAISKTLNEEMVLSGASTAEATRAITDMVHGMAGGVLQARQMRMMMQQMPDLARVLAEGLGTNVKGLEAMIHAGLPLEKVLQALGNEAGKIDDRFQTMPKTFARVWTELSNAVEQYIGRASQAGAISGIVKDAISGLATHINEVATAAELVGIAMAAWLGGKGLQAISGSIVALKEMALAQGAYATAAMKSAEADIATAQANITLATAQKEAQTATLAKTTALETEALAAMDAMQAQKFMLVQNIALNQKYAEQVAAQGMEAVGANQAIAESRAQIVAIDAKLIPMEAELLGVETRLSVAATAQAAATEAQAIAARQLAASQAALGVAQAEATSAMGLLSRAGSGVLAMIGGWPTVILAAAAALVYFASKTDAVGEEIDKLNKKADELAQQNATFAQTLFAISKGLDVAKMSVRDKTQADIDMLQAMINAAPWYDTLTGKTSDWKAALALARGELVALDKAQMNVDFQGFVRKVQLAADAVRNMFGGNGTTSINSELEAENDKATKSMEKLDAAAGKTVATFGLGKAAVAEYERGQDLLKKTAGLTGQALADETAFVYKLWQNQIDAGQAEDALTAAKKSGTAASKDAAKAAREHSQDEAMLTSILQKAAAAMEKADGLAAQLSEGLSGPYAAAQNKYNKEVDSFETAMAAANTELANGVITQETYNKKIAEYTQGEQDAAKAADDTNQALIEKNDIIDQQITKLQGIIAAGQQLGPMQKAELETDKQIAAALKAGHDLYGVHIADVQKLTDTLAKERPELLSVNEAIIANEAAIKNAAKAQEEYQRIAESGLTSITDAFGQFFTGQIKSWHDLGTSIIGTVKNFIAQIIGEYVKLNVLGPIVSSLFGSGQAYGMSYGGVAQAGMSLLSGSGSGGTDFTSTASGGTANSLFNDVSSIYSAGKTLWSGWFSGAQDAGALGDFTGYGTQGLNYGAGGFNASTAGTGGTGGIGFGQALGIAGGIYAGYNEYNNAGGGAAGLVGGAAYGIGTVVGAGALGGFALGAGGLAAGTAGAATAGGTAAAGSIGLSAIPVVGWIALAAMLVDMISGGKLFGTGGEFVGGNTTETIGSKGANVGTNITVKSQGALFSGASWDESAVASDPKAIAAANAFYAALVKGTDDFAKQFNIKAADIVGGSFQQAFDKNGKVTGTTTTIGADTYKDETPAQFAERIQSLNFLAVLDKLGLGASAFVAKFKASADDFYKATQDFAGAAQAANVDLGKGLHFLAQSAGTTLVSVMKFVEGMQSAGETLTQTYARLAQAQNAYDKFVAGFKPSATYVDDFEAKLSAIDQQMKANIAQANALAKAAGAEGAATSDLVNIHQQAASQMAALVTALEASAQSLAFSLGLTTQGNLSEVNAEIARLQGLSKSASSSVSSFGSAMTSVSQSATAAIALLLGTLSPLSDAQKLQVALNGQRAGTVTPDQVLQIGRALYASSQAYNALFAQVQAIGDHTGKGSSGGSSSGATSSTTTNMLTPADQARLNALLKEQAMLQQAQTLGQYQTLAQQIAEIAKGETFQQVIKDMGVDQTLLEKGLGIKSDKDLATYIANIQKQTDSNHDNTISIVAELKLILDAIRNPPPAHTLPTGHGTHGQTTAPDTSGNSGNGDGPRGRNTNNRALSDGDVQALGMVIARAILGNTRNVPQRRELVR